jgi:hypothetical protein
VNGDLNRPLQVEAERFRDPTVLSFEPAQVSGIAIPGAPSAQLTRHAERWWVDGIGPADATAVSDLLRALGELQFDRYGGDLGTTAEWVLSFADREPLRLALGSLTDEGVVARGPDGRVGVVEPESIAALPRRGEELLAASAFSLALDASDRVSLEHAEQTFVATRNGSAWQTPSADDGAVWTWVSALARAAVISRPPGVLEPVEIVVTVDGQRIELGPAHADGYRLARDGGTGQIFAVEAAPVEEALTAARAATAR